MPIELRRVTVNNLKEIDLDLPYGELIVVCGRSGSGKSSLAIDTLYAEGQRRYIESFSAYTRQFLEKLEKPNAERIDGIPPSIAVTSQSLQKIGRSTVGTATETTAYLRLLFAKIGDVFCPDCSREIRVDTAQSILNRLLTDFGTKLENKDRQQRIQIAFAPILFPDKLEFEASLKEQGFVRGVVGTHPFRLDEGGIPAALYKKAFTAAQKQERANAFSSDTASLLRPFDQGKILIVIDRLTLGQTDPARVVASLEQALDLGDGTCFVLVSDAKSATADADDTEANEQRLVFSRRMACEHCSIEMPPLEPRLFSFNNSRGACPKCEGFGTQNPEKSERNHSPCPECGGTRLRREALSVCISNRNIADLSEMTIRELSVFFASLDLEDNHRHLAKTALEQIRLRLEYLSGVGLDYLTLSRTMQTLSSGEQRRVGLTSALGSSLVDMLYVLDEPSVGLHPKDTQHLLKAVRSLRDRGNTVVVVEHEEEFLRAADQVIEIGPGAGEAGGKIVFQGTPQEMIDDPQSLTGAYLSGKRTGKFSANRRQPDRGVLELVGCRGNNLKNLTVAFPLRMFCVVTGVSGAGKSSLVKETLYPALCRHFDKETVPAGLPFERINSSSLIEDVILVDQSLIGRTLRSNPATYMKIFDEIRNVFASMVDAKVRQFTASKFSFNVSGGRCESCKGDGFTVIDMQFMADMYVRCSQCQGKRYQPEILDILYRGRNIADVLDMTVREAFGFFRGQPQIQKKLKNLIDVGLDYVQLGQSAKTLSGGESQRLKLAWHLSKINKDRSLFILDEPTAGLHFADVVQLLDSFDALVGSGHSLVVVEHNLQIIRAADYIIDLGPGAADLGGRIVAKGTPEEVAQVEESVTGRFLNG